ncbi:tRNA guanosine(34) transglycosylase Tgt [Methylobacterium sp. A54F]
MSTLSSASPATGAPPPGAPGPTADFAFAVAATDGQARTGALTMPRGVIRTPAFMPVGTAATVKAMYPEQVRDLGADVVLGNTYHLMLRPGPERMARLGGLHRFMRWDGPILTDSGGFQVMSLASLRKLDEQGVTFRSHVDGSAHHMSPERSIEIQGLLGSDIQMQLDECVRLPAEPAEVERAMRLSLRWAERCRAAFGEQRGKALFGIVQGGDVPALRVESARTLVDLDLKGYAVGGLAVGEPQAVMLAMIETVEPHLPRDKPRYLMGVGTPDDILRAVERGIDMFDCVMPTRAGRHGLAYTRHGRINLRNARYAEETAPLDEASSCPAARDYARAYLHHLVRTDEILGMMLLTWNNLAYYQALMAGIRAAIREGRFADFAGETREAWARAEAARKH